MGARGSKSSSSIKIPDINNMPSSERPKAKEDLVASLNGQMIAFGFRKVDLDSQSEEVLKSFAEGISFLPEYALRIEGHSNLAKSEKKLTAEDKARIQKLSEDRADACARFLKAASVQNEITCVGQGPLKGETKGCVRLVLSKKWTPPQVSESKNLHTLEGETSLSKNDLDSANDAVVNTLTPDIATVEEASIAPLQSTDAQFTIQVLPENSSSEEGPKPSYAEETDVPSTLQSSAGLEPSTNPTHMDASGENASPNESDVLSATMDSNKKLMSDESTPPASSPPAKPDQWGSTYLPWYITCCSPKTKPETDDCPLQGLPVKQIGMSFQ